MTREQILQMEAGPNMDRLVTKQVLDYIDMFYVPPEGGIHVGPPPVSSELWASWKVVEKLTGDGWHFKLAYYGQDWYALLTRGSSFAWQLEATGETPMLAICRVAVMAAELERKEVKDEGPATSAGQGKA